MKHLLKHKSYGKILNLVKYKRHKVGTKIYLSFSKKKMDRSAIQIRNRKNLIEKPELFVLDFKTDVTNTKKKEEKQSNPYS
jgi:hypothetical protein